MFMGSPEVLDTADPTAADSIVANSADNQALPDLLKQEPSPKEEVEATQILAAGQRLIEEVEGKLLDQSARAKGLSRYLEALATVNRLDQKSATVTNILANIAWALRSRQDAAAALLWALDKSGLVRYNPKSSEIAENQVE